MAESVNNQNPVITGLHNLTTPQIKNQVRNFEGADFLTFFESEIAPAPAPKRKPKASNVEEPPKKIAIKNKENKRSDSKPVERKEISSSQDQKTRKFEQNEVRTEDNSDNFRDNESLEEVAPKETSTENASQTDQVVPVEKPQEYDTQVVPVEKPQEYDTQVVPVEKPQEHDTPVDELAIVSDVMVQTQVSTVVIDDLIELSEEQVDASLNTLIQIENLQASPQLRERLVELLENIEEGLEQEIFSLDDSIVDEELNIDLGQFVSLLKELVVKPDESMQPIVESSAFQQQLTRLDELVDQSVELFENTLLAELEDVEVDVESTEELTDSQKLQLKKNQGSKNISELVQSQDIESVEVKTDQRNESTLDKKINKMLAIARQGMNLRDGHFASSDKNMNHNVASTTENALHINHVNQNSGTDLGKGKHNGQNKNLEFINSMIQQTAGAKSNLSQKFADLLEPATKTQTKDISGLSSLENNIRKSQAGQMVRKPAFARSQSVILNQIIESSKALKPPIMNSIRIILKPDHLGELRLTVKQIDDQMRVRLEADNQTVKEVLDKNSQAIRDALRQQGLDVDRVEVELRHNKQDQQQAEEQAQDSESKKNKNKEEFSLEDEIDEMVSLDEVLGNQVSQVNQLA